MPNPAWKQFERAVAALFPGGLRFWANSGELLDVEADGYVAQCKLVCRCSLEALTQLAETAAHQGQIKNKIGVVAVKVRRGRGKASPLLIVQTEAAWRAQHGPTQ